MSAQSVPHSGLSASSKVRQIRRYLIRLTSTLVTASSLELINSWESSVKKYQPPEKAARLAFKTKNLIRNQGQVWLLVLRWLPVWRENHCQWSGIQEKSEREWFILGKKQRHGVLGLINIGFVTAVIAFFFITVETGRELLSPFVPLSWRKCRLCSTSMPRRPLQLPNNG